VCLFSDTVSDFDQFIGFIIY